jgi:hypothetical protein
MNIKLIATTTSILTSILIVYFFFIIMKPNTNEKVVPMHLKNDSHRREITADTNTNEDAFDPDLDDGYDNGIERYLLDNIKPLSSDTENLLPANELKLENYKDLENISSEKEFYTNDTPLFSQNEGKNKKATPIDLNSEHRRVNFY